MIRSGQLRACSACRHWTFKEEGKCNAIEYAKCGVWCNWRTKQQGRMSGSLSEPGESEQVLPLSVELVFLGELHYQLQQKNSEEFIALLEPNGIEHDPNYVRGLWDDEWTRRLFRVTFFNLMIDFLTCLWSPLLNTNSFLDPMFFVSHQAKRCAEYQRDAVAWFVCQGSSQHRLALRQRSALF